MKLRLSPLEFEDHIETFIPDYTDAVLMRRTFQLPDPGLISSLKLQLRYDDGFLAYLNGELVAAANAPDDSDLFSNAEAARSNSEAVLFETFNLSGLTGLADPLDHLVVGNNVLAIHALNLNMNSELLIEAKLEARQSSLRMPLQSTFFSKPSPSVGNGESLLGIVDDATVTVERGFYESPINVDITTPTLGSTLIYTTDGSVPSLSNGVQVLPADANTAPLTSISISSTTVLRIAVFKQDFYSLAPTTHTYAFMEDDIVNPWLSLIPPVHCFCSRRCTTCQRSRSI